MTDPYVGEIQIYGFSFAPYNWAFCAGQTIPIQQNTALFSLIGVIYGGNGTTNFMLPNMASRQACSSGQGPGLSARQVGETFGAFNVTLTQQELPTHNHNLVELTPPDPTALIETPTINAGYGYCGNSVATPFGTGAATTMSPATIAPAGGGLPHANEQPFLALNYSIALYGTFPSFS